MILRQRAHPFRSQLRLISEVLISKARFWEMTTEDFSSTDLKIVLKLAICGYCTLEMWPVQTELPESVVVS